MEPENDWIVKPVAQAQEDGYYPSATTASGGETQWPN